MHSDDDLSNDLFDFFPYSHQGLTFTGVKKHYVSLFNRHTVYANIIPYTHTPSSVLKIRWHVSEFIGNYLLLFNGWFPTRPRWSESNHRLTSGPLEYSIE